MVLILPKMNINGHFRVADIPAWGITIKMLYYYNTSTISGIVVNAQSCIACAFSTANFVISCAVNLHYTILASLICTALAQDSSHI